VAVHQDWSTPAFDLPALAEAVGPFPHRSWLRTWWRERGRGELLITDSGSSLVALTLRADVLELAGEPDLTDYHSPLGNDPASAICAVVEELPTGVSIRFDSLPAEASRRVAEALHSNGLAPTITQHEVAAVLQLPGTFDEYLASISKKERHELRRKRRRFENERGPATLRRMAGPEAVSLFADLHRRSAGDKGAFMTPTMERFFLALHTDAGGVIDVLVDGSGQAAAAVFSFEDEEATYLYNSAFEPEVGNLSPGNVVLSLLIETAIVRGRTIFDFLKGDETYKFRLGARPRPLFEISAMTGSGR
jgi:CelD/BcsL family acetyltransferase involved in cellulose biosynthesis